MGLFHRRVGIGCSTGRMGGKLCKWGCFVGGWGLGGRRAEWAGSSGRGVFWYEGGGWECEGGEGGLVL